MRARTGQNDLFDRYVDGPPALQNAIDAVPGWTTALPAEYGVVSGRLGLAADGRIVWLIEQLGGVTGLRVLELGPLEGGHTSMLHAAGAARIDAIEANRLAYLRCLITKEIMGLDRARFHLGDFTRGLGTAEGRYDVIVASGVLYHVSDPIALLETLAAHTDRLYLWSHVYDDEAMPKNDPRRGAFTGSVTRREMGGAVIALHERRYHGAQTSASFCGGPRDRHVWIERSGLLAALRVLGFNDLTIGSYDSDYPGGPAVSLLARRQAAGPGGGP